MDYALPYVYKGKFSLVVVVSIKSLKLLKLASLPTSSLLFRGEDRFKIVIKATNPCQARVMNPQHPSRNHR